MWAFYDCSSLAAITIPKSVTNIGEWAFYDCSSLAAITILESVTNIGENAFGKCSSLAAITIPNSVTNIGQGAFWSCTQLNTVTVGWVTPLSIYANVFLGVTCSNVTLKVPIGTASLYRNTDVWKEFKISVEQSELPCATSSVYGAINSLVWAICDNTLKFNGSGKIPDYTSNNSPWYAHRSSIQNVEIGDNIPSIGSYAFSGCTNLVSMTIPKTVTSIGTNAFFNCSNLTLFDVDNENTNYSSENGILFNKSKTILICYPPKKTESSFSIPNNVTTIWDNAFYNCRNLTFVTIPESIIYIENSAFSNCTSLATVNFNARANA